MASIVVVTVIAIPPIVITTNSAFTIIKIASCCSCCLSNIIFSVNEGYSGSKIRLGDWYVRHIPSIRSTATGSSPTGSPL